MPGSTKWQWRFGARTYSLNEAAGIQRQCLDGSHTPECPRCSTFLKLIEGGNATENFVLVICPFCEVSQIVPLPTTSLAGAHGP
jgi:hypothetical protein